MSGGIQAARAGEGTVVIVPTYNERESLPKTLRRLRAAVPAAHVLVVDDGSPDGTGEIAENLAREMGAMDVLHRAGKSGLGSAYVAGFGWALERGFTVAVEMDADGSHRPEQLPDVLEALEARGDDLAIGSRWVRGGRVENWPKHREVLSRGANTYTRLALGMSVRDATAGFRAYRCDLLGKLDLATVASQGYCFQVDLARRAIKAGYHVVEVPITFVERELGDSKMSRDILVEALWRVTTWGVGERVGKVLGRDKRPDAGPGGPETSDDKSTKSRASTNVPDGNA